MKEKALFGKEVVAQVLFEAAPICLSDVLYILCVCDQTLFYVMKSPSLCVCVYFMKPCFM
jgi:hypothetical protein